MVATAVNGVRELVRHEETGLPVPPGNPRALARAIDRLAADAELAERISAGARRMVLGFMGSERMVSAIETLYHQAAASRLPLPSPSVS